jgi:hypothetical protein
MAALPNFPELSRAPKMDEKETFDDPSIRDKMENGMVYSRPRFVRLRRTVKVGYYKLTADDRQQLRDFVRKVGGWSDFHFVDGRIAENPETLRVYFSKLPEITDDGYAGGQKRFSVTFEITER